MERKRFLKRFILSSDSEGAFGSESATRRRLVLDSDLDGEKLWRRQVFGARMLEKNGRRWGKAVAAPGVRGQDAREKWKKTLF